MSRPIPKPSDMVEIPGHPGEWTNPVVVDVGTAFCNRFGLWVSDSFPPGKLPGGNGYTPHSSEEHNVYGTAWDIGPYSGDWYGTGTTGFRTALQLAVHLGWNPVYYNGTDGTVAAANHGPGNHAHITILTATEYRGDVVPNAGDLFDDQIHALKAKLALVEHHLKELRAKHPRTAAIEKEIAHYSERAVKLRHLITALGGNP